MYSIMNTFMGSVFQHYVIFYFPLQIIILQ